MTAASSVDSIWNVKALPTLDSTLQPYRWPYGPAALVQERSTMTKILEAVHEIRMPSLHAWAHVPISNFRYGIGFLGMYMSTEDVFVNSDHSRNMLVDRAHQCFNVDWKMEVQALSANTNDGLDAGQRASFQFLNYQTTEQHLYDVVDLIDTLQGLYNELKPETVELINRCASIHEVKKSMVMTNEPHAFWSLTPPSW